MAFSRVNTEVKNILLWHRHFAIIETCSQGKGSETRQKPKRPDHQPRAFLHSRVEAERSPGARVVRRCWLGGRGGQARNMGSHWVLRGVSTTPHTHFLLPSNQHFQCKTTRKGIGQKMGSLRGPSNQCCVIVTDRSVSLLSPELERLGRLTWGAGGLLGEWWALLAHFLPVQSMFSMQSVTTGRFTLPRQPAITRSIVANDHLDSYLAVQKLRSTLTPCWPFQIFGVIRANHKKCMKYLDIGIPSKF